MKLLLSTIKFLTTFKGRISKASVVEGVAVSVSSCRAKRNMITMAIGCKPHNLHRLSPTQ